MIFSYSFLQKNIDAADFAGKLNNKQKRRQIQVFWLNTQIQSFSESYMSLFFFG